MSRATGAGIAAAAVLACGACASPPEVALCVRTAPGEDPFAIPELTELVLRATPLEGLAIQQAFRPDDSTLRLPTLDYGTWSFTLEANHGSTTRARGLTPFVEVTSADERIPCLYFAEIGTFGDTPAPPPDDPIHLVFSAPESPLALLATDDGLVRYDHETGSFASERLPLPVSPIGGAVWTNLLGGRAAVITPEGQGAILGPDGARQGGVTTLQGVGPLDGVAAVRAGERSVLLIGGADDFTTPPPAARSLRIVDLADGSVRSLPTDLVDPLTLRDTRVGLLEDGTFLIAGGNEGSGDSPVPSAIIAVIDPDSGVIGAGRLDVARRDAAVVVTGGNVLVFGGRDGSGALLDTIERFQFLGDQPVPLEAPSRLLTTPRAGALALVAGGGVLVVGGETGAPSTDATADRYTFESDDAVASSAPGVALHSPVAGPLHDGTILIVSPGAAVVYRP